MGLVGDESGFSFGIITVIEKRHELVHFVDNRKIQSTLQLFIKSVNNILCHVNLYPEKKQHCGICKCGLTYTNNEIYLIKKMNTLLCHECCKHNKLSQKC
jgi:hypothetical protein